jgi:DNA-binding XRE family transcriptional regulator
MVRARRAAVGGRMRELRKQAGLTQEAVAGAAGLTRQFYLVVEAGQRTCSWTTCSRSLTRSLPIPASSSQSCRLAG